jgi:flagellar assembly protein FliH
MDMSHSIRPFEFDRVLAGPRRPAADSLLEAEALRFELGQLRASSEDALARARAEGFENGLKAAREEQEAALLAATDALHESLTAAEEQLAAAIERITRGAAEATLAAADLIAGRAVAAAPLQAINEALGRVLEQAGRNPSIIVKVHPELACGMDRIVKARTGAERRRMSLRVVGDHAIARGDALILWDEGRLELDLAARRSAVLEEVGRLLDN